MLRLGRAAGVSQPRWESFLEALLNIGSGFALSWAVWVWVAGPLFEIQTDARQGFWITVLFTVVSVVRSYCWRRAFNYWRYHR